MSIEEGVRLWEPSGELSEHSNVARFISWLNDTRHLDLDGYRELWRWSVDQLEDFWQAIWDYFEVQSTTDHEMVLDSHEMPGAKWFPGSHLNFAQHILRNERPGETVLHAYSEIDPPRHVAWDELASDVRVVAERLRSMGVQPGDWVAAYLPNVPEAAIALLASASIGAVFSSCSPDFGHRSVVDRFSQIDPVVLFCVDGYRFGGKDFDRRAEVVEIVSQLPSLTQVVQLDYLDPEGDVFVDGAVRWRDLIAGPPVPAAAFEFEQVPFDHPLWVVYSSGTTGLPKPIVHSQGGIVVEFLKLAGFHMNLGPESTMFFYTTTGWVMWNIVIGAAITGSAAVLYDGNPIADPATLWWLAEDSGTTFFGASPTFVAAMEAAGVEPGATYDLSRLEGILLGGSPVTPESMQWCYDHVKSDLWVTSQSGGTDICSGFVGASPTLPVHAGEIQAICLGVDAVAMNEAGEPVVDEVGELVVRKPMPSMPIYFWNDPDDERYRATYFQDYPGLWRHGDFFKINQRGGCYISGRSDSTLNRFGVRIGTAEIYRAVERLDEVDDSLIVNLDLPEGRFFMPLFVVVSDGHELDPDLTATINRVLRAECSPRHVPDRIVPVPEIPYTLTGKKMEIPVRKILAGHDPVTAANRDAMANPSALDAFIGIADSIPTR